MPAKSQAQQKFFNLVKAVQAGHVPPAKVTSNVRQAARDISKDDVGDYAKTPLKGLPVKAPKPKIEAAPGGAIDNQKDLGGVDFNEIVGRYADYGKMLHREHTLSELGQQLSDIAEYAEQALTSQVNEDWFDKYTIQRNIKEMKGYAGEFSKLAKEADMSHKRMKALYDDMGRVLERYFEMYDSDTAPTSANVAAGQPKTEPQNENSKLVERAIELLKAKMSKDEQQKFESYPRSIQERIAWKGLRI